MERKLSIYEPIGTNPCYAHTIIKGNRTPFLFPYTTQSGTLYRVPVEAVLLQIISMKIRTLSASSFLVPVHDEGQLAVARLPPVALAPPAAEHEHGAVEGCGARGLDPGREKKLKEAEFPQGIEKYVHKLKQPV